MPMPYVGDDFEVPGLDLHGQRDPDPGADGRGGTSPDWREDWGWGIRRPPPDDGGWVGGWGRVGRWGVRGFTPGGRDGVARSSSSGWRRGKMGGWEWVGGWEVRGPPPPGIGGGVRTHPSPLNVFSTFPSAPDRTSSSCRVWLLGRKEARSSERRNRRDPWIGGTIH